MRKPSSAAGHDTNLRLHDRLRDEIVDVEPSDARRCCGSTAAVPTVYGRIHVGNARPVLDGDGAQARLASSCSACRCGWRSTSPTSTTRSTRAAASRACRSARARRRRWPQAYRDDTDALGLGRPDVEPLASETIPEIVALIERLIERGAAYATGDGDVYFSVAALSGATASCRASGPTS